MEVFASFSKKKRFGFVSSRWTALDRHAAEGGSR